MLVHVGEEANGSCGMWGMRMAHAVQDISFFTTEALKSICTCKKV